MEIVNKKISLECLKSRFNGNILAYNGTEELRDDYLLSDKYSDYGYFPDNIILLNSDGKTAAQILEESDTYCDSDIISTVGDILPMENTMPLSVDADGNTVLRYKIMISALTLLKNIILESVFYRYCKRNDGDRWIEIKLDNLEISGETYENITDDTFNKFFTNDIEVISELTVIGDGDTGTTIEYGHVVCVTTEDNAYRYAKTFIIDGERYDGKFYNLAMFFYHNKSLIYNAENGTTTIADIFSTPYINIPLFISQNYDDMGILTPDVQIWEAGKTYLWGDKVFYAYSEDPYGSIYVLSGTGKFDNITACTNYIYSNFTNLNDDGTLYFGKKYKSYNGNYVENKDIIYFDDIDETTGGLILNHWTKCIETNDTDEGKTITDLTESKLYKIDTIPYDTDVISNNLPFLVKDGLKRLDVETTSEETLYNTYLRYMLGVHKTDYETNVLTDIIFYGDDEETPLGTFTYEVKTDEETNEKYIDRKKINVDDVSDYADDIKAIVLKYIIGCDIDEECNITGGVKYEDRYICSISKYGCLYFGKAYNDNEGNYDELYGIFEYVSDEDLGIEPQDLINRTDQFNYGTIYLHGGDGAFNNEEYTIGKYYMLGYVFNYFSVGSSTVYDENSQDEVKGVLSYTTITDRQRKIDDFQNVYTIKDESLFGIADTTEKLDVSVDRGSSASFERHNILSEINTFQDLENYRNNYFEI